MLDLTQYEPGFTAASGSFSYSKLPDPGATDLFFSEYIEGSGFVKYVEVFNGTGSPIDLSDYEFRLYTNGSPTPSRTQALEGILEACEVLVLANPQARGYTGDIVFTTSVNFSGDDALELYNTKQ